MSKQIQEAYIVAAVRTPVGKAPRGMFRNVRPDDMLAHALRSALARCPGLDPAAVEDVIVGCAMPEAEQVPSVSCLDATPERDAAPQLPACLRAPSRSHPHEWGPCSTFRRTFPCTGEGHGMGAGGHPSSGRRGIHFVSRPKQQGRLGV